MHGAIAEEQKSVMYWMYGMPILQEQKSETWLSRKKRIFSGA